MSVAAESVAARHGYPLSDAVRTEVLCDYQPQGEGGNGQLTLCKGDIVWVIDRSDPGWWGGHKEGDDLTGWVPAKLLQLTDDESRFDESMFDDGSSMHAWPCGASPDPTRTADNRMVASPQVGHHRRMAHGEAATAELSEAKQKLEAAQRELVGEKRSRALALAEAKEVGAAAEAQAAQFQRQLEAAQQQLAAAQQKLDGLQQAQAKEEQSLQQERQQWAAERTMWHQKAQELKSKGEVDRGVHEQQVSKLREELRELKQREAELGQHRASGSEQHASRVVTREASLGATSREGSVQRRLFDGSGQDLHLQTSAYQTPQPPSARALLHGSPVPVAVMPVAGVAAAGGQISTTAAMPTISTLPPGNSAGGMTHTHGAQSVGPPLSARHTVPTHGHGTPQPHLSAGQPPRPCTQRTGSYVPPVTVSATTRTASVPSSSPAMRVRDVREAVGDTPKREVRSLVAAYERRSGSAAPPAAVLAQTRGHADPSPSRRYVAQQPAVGSSARTASREAPAVRAAADTETPRQRAGGVTEEQMAVNFGMSPIHKRGAAMHMSRTASPARMMNSSPSPNKVQVSVQDRIRLFSTRR